MFCYLEMTLSFQEQRLMLRCGEYQLVYWMKWLSQWKSGMLTIQNMLALRLLYSSILVCIKIWSMLKHWKITLTNRQEKKRHGRFSANEENSVFYHKHAMKKILDFLRGKWTTQTLFLCMMFYHRAADNLFASLGITSRLLLKGVKAPAGNYEQKETKVDINAVFSINFISMAVEMKIDIGHQHFLPIRSYSCGFCAIKIFFYFPFHIVWELNYLPVCLVVFITSHVILQLIQWTWEHAHHVIDLWKFTVI